MASNLIHTSTKNSSSAILIRRIFLFFVFLVSLSVSADEIWQYTYNSQGKIETADGPRTDVSDVSTYSYDVDGHLTGIQNALGQSIIYTDHDALGRATRMVDMNNVTTLVSYNENGQVNSTTLVSPDGNSANNLVTSYEYDVLGLMTKVTQPDGSETHYVYGAARRLEAIYNNAGDRIEYEQDAAGNVIQENILDYNGTLHYQLGRVYDELNRLMELQNNPASSSTFSYDTNDNLTDTVDGRNLAHSSEYDTLDRLKKTIDPLLNDTAFTYDDQDRLTSVTDARGLTTYYQYDVYGNQVLLDSPDTGVTTYTYDDAGNRTSMLDNNGIIVSYTYDALNRLLTVTYPDDTSENITYIWDDSTNGNYGKGRLTRITDNSGEINFRYDFAGRLVEKHYSIAGQHYSLNYNYAANGHLVKIIYPGGREVRYGHDSVGRTNAIYTKAGTSTAEQLVLSSVHYLPYGPIESFVYGNGVVQELDYDSSYRPTTIHSGGTATIIERHYSYDGNGNIIAISTEQGSNDDRTLAYDELDRLGSLTHYTNSFFYSYDAVGNRLSRNITDNGQQITETYSYASDSNRLNNIAITNPQGNSTRSFGYDNNGNVTADTFSGAITGQTTINYAESNRPESATASGINVQYTHNSLGQRTVKSTATKTEHYHYDENGQLIAVSDNSGNIQQQIIFLGALPVAVLAENGSVAEPIVNISSPVPNAKLELGVNYNFTATANDAVDGNISNSIEWHSSQSGLLGTGSSLSVSSLSLGGHIITAKVQNSNNIIGLSAVGVSVVAFNEVPQVVPGSLGYTEISNLHTVELSAIATDAEDGNISQHIQWTSSIDGHLGSGASILTTLSLGNHIITASVTDSLGKSKSENATLLVREINSQDDFDSDGLPDEWEFLHFDNLNQLPGNDFDSDGIDNESEYLNQTDPTDFLSVQLLLDCEGADGSTTILDGSLSGRSVTVSGHAKISHTPAAKFGNGSCNFDGSGDRLAITIPPLGTKDFTFDFWLQPRNAGLGNTWGRIIQVGQNNSSTGFALYHVGTTNPMEVYSQVRAPGSPHAIAGGWVNVFPPATSSSPISDNVWHHIVLQRASGEWSLYIDGERDLYQAALPAGNNIGETTLYIGANQSLSESFNGMIDQMRLTIVNHAPQVILNSLSYSETTSLHTVALSATAMDTEDGNISQQVQWTSSIDGHLGSGASISTTLSIGNHVLSASVTDSLGKSHSQNITLSVREINSQDDFDSDGLPDEWEFLYFNNLNQLPGNDFDSDGVDNGSEYSNQTNPTDFLLVQLLLDCEGANGSTAILDGSLAGRTVTVSGHAKISHTPTAKFGSGSCNFDGSGDRLAITISPLGTSDFTLEFWLQPRNAGLGNMWGRIVQVGKNTTSTGLALYHVGTTNPMQLYSQVRAGGWVNVFPPATSSSPVSDNIWHHIVLQRASGEWSLYIDGTRDLHQTALPSGNNINETTLYIGANQSLSESFNGMIDGLRLSIGLARYSGTSITN